MEWTRALVFRAPFGQRDIPFVRHSAVVGDNRSLTDVRVAFQRSSRVISNENFQWLKNKLRIVFVFNYIVDLLCVSIIICMCV